MLEPLPPNRLPAKALTISAALVFLVVSFLLILDFTGISFARRPTPPALPIVSTCRDLAPGMSRIGEPGKLQFDVLAEDFQIQEGNTDAPPLVHGLDLSYRDGKSSLEINYGPSLHNWLDHLARVFPSHTEERTILDNTGQRVGTDEWEYVSGGKRRRKIHFRGFVTAIYPFVDAQEAQIFDQVINSACIPAPN